MEDIDKVAGEIKIQAIAVNAAMTEVVEEAKQKSRELKAKRFTLYNKKNELLRSLKQTIQSPEINKWAKSLLKTEIPFKSASLRFCLTDGDAGVKHGSASIGVQWQGEGELISLTKAVPDDRLKTLCPEISRYLEVCEEHKTVDKEFNQLELVIAQFNGMRTKYNNQATIKALESREDTKALLEEARSKIPQFQSELDGKFKLLVPDQDPQ